MKTNEEITRVWMLLDVMAKSIGYPKFKAIHDTAEAELVRMAGELGKVPSNEELVRTKAQASTPRVYPANSGVSQSDTPATEVRRFDK